MKAKPMLFRWMIVTLFSGWIEATVGLAQPTLRVANLNSSGPGSLRQAVTDANVAGGGTVLLTTLSGTITVSGGPLEITSRVRILGPGPNQLELEGGSEQGIILVGPHVQDALIAGVRIRRGFTRSVGAGILNRGRLTIVDCVISDNVTFPNELDFYRDQIPTVALGAGIYNAGELALYSSVISNNICGSGVGGAWGGQGGGLYNLGQAFLEDTSVVNNSSGRGGNGFFWYGGQGGNGGGIYNRGHLYLFRCTVSDNATGDGGVGWDGDHVPGATAGHPGGDGGSGGGIYSSGHVSLVNCTLAANRCGNGGAGGDGGLGSEPFERGGFGGEGGDGGSGGGMAGPGNHQLIQCTVAFNQSGQSGAGGAPGVPGPGGGPGEFGVAGAPGEGGGMSGAAEALDSIIAHNRSDGVGQDLFGDFTSLGSCLIEAVRGARLRIGFSDILGQDPLLAPLSYDGGLVKTCRLSPGSPALDAGSFVAGNPSTDARGVIRPQGIRSDIGAYEWTSSSLAPRLQLVRNYGLSLLGMPGRSYRVETRDHPVLGRWQPVRSAQSGAGVFVLVVPWERLLGPTRFYRAVELP